MIFNFILIIFAHYILDYPLQSDYLAITKGKDWYSLLAHSLIYALGISLCLYYIECFEIWKCFILIISHYIIDYKKSHAIDKKKSNTIYLYIDQILHICINIILIFI
jgi:hypothetical protein